MSETTSAPPGWYPDPAGAPQWRVWTGTAWSAMTRPYGSTDSSHAVSDLELYRSLRAVIRYGVVGAIGGVALFIGVLVHLPHTAHPSPSWFTEVAVAASAALFTIGSMTYAGAARALRGKWAWYDFVPLVNLEVLEYLIARRLSSSPTRRIVSNVVLMALYATQFRSAPWLAVAPPLVALSHTFWVGELLERLDG